MKVLTDRIRTDGLFRPMLFCFALTASLLIVSSGWGQDTPDTPDTPFEPTSDYPDPSAYRPSLSDNHQGAGYFGRVTADGIAFNYMNNFLMMRQVYEHLRNVPLVTYHGEEAVPASSGYPGYSTGGMNTAPYGPGYAPAYEQSIYSNGYQGYNQGYQGYDQSGQIVPQQGTAADIYRGQAQYGDPGTLIYSLWGGVIGGDGEVKRHKDMPGYDTEQGGGMVGLDLFCSSDCRSGLFYGYQQGKIKGLFDAYGWATNPTGTLTNTVTVDTDVTDLYTTVYDYTGNYNGTYSATLKSQNHLVGIYHEFGDEFVYNVATLRGGYNKVKTSETLNESGTSSGTLTYDYGQYESGVLDTDTTTSNTLSAESASSSGGGTYSNKYDEYLAGVSFERGAHFKLAPFTITPRGLLDYTYLHREKTTMDAYGGTYSLGKGDYHSLRSDLGANLSLDLYPGSQHLKGIVRGSWVHEFLSDIYGDVDVSTPYYSHTIKGNSIGRDWALLGAGLEWTIVPSFMVFGNYDYMMNKYLRQHYGTVGAALMW